MDISKNEPLGQVEWAGKKFYEQPVITTFGSVAKLTLGGGGTRTDLGNPHSGGNHGH